MLSVYGIRMFSCAHTTPPSVLACLETHGSDSQGYILKVENVFVCTVTLYVQSVG